MRPSSSPLSALGLSLLVVSFGLVACQKEETEPEDSDVFVAGVQDVSLAFQATFGAEKASCTSASSEIGLTSASVRLADLRLYVTDVVLHLEDGQESPFTLKATPPWSNAQVSLLDFGIDAGRCAQFTPGSHTTLEGSASVGSPITGVSFTIGLPRDLSMLPVEDAEPPLDQADLWLGSTQGRAYFQLMVEDVQQGNKPWTAQVAAIGCTGAQACQAEPLLDVTLPSFDPESQVIRLDLKALLSRNDVSTDLGGSSHLTGCPAIASDDDCKVFFPTYGLGAAGPQWISAVKR